MNVTNLFYPHESDSRIMIKKDKAEVDNWTDDMEYINEELEYLLDIEERMLNSSELYKSLHGIRRENQLRLGELYRYDANMRNAIECDTMECDTFYLRKHEKNRNIYLDHVKNYRVIKSKMLTQILLHAKR